LTNWSTNDHGGDGKLSGGQGKNLYLVPNLKEKVLVCTFVPTFVLSLKDLLT
jgi:hypothetical protein